MVRLVIRDGSKCSQWSNELVIQLCIINESHNYAQVKNGQKLVFFKYSRVIYGWKAYGEVNTDFVKKVPNFHFWAQNGPKWTKKGPKMVKNWFSSNIVVSYIVGKLMARWSQPLQFFVKFFILGPKMDQNGPKKGHKGSKIGFLQI